MWNDFLVCRKLLDYIWLIIHVIVVILCVVLAGKMERKEGELK